MSYTPAITVDAARPAWQEALAVVVYPVSFVLAIATFLWAHAHGYPKWASAYLPVVMYAAIALPVLERVMPYRRDWRPDGGEWRTDALYALVIQIAIPSLLALLLVLALSGATRPYLHASIWPHHWPILAQGVLVVLLVDLMRYWVHRLAHTNPILWRLHAVHHAPHRLYWLNTARFHPLEKVLHFTFDSLPFILLGVNEYVLGFYFVCYAVNGFYQHSNVYLRPGLLSYIFSTAELHRWHHSKLLAEANHNYSNTTIVWDIVFGTYYRPRDRRLGRIGIENDDYPMTFVRQLIAPFVRDIERRDVFVATLRESAMNLLLRLGFAKIGWTVGRAFARATHDVARVQERVLRAILHRNRDTAFGRLHGFAEIRSVADYRERCPVQSYDSLHPFIDAQERTGEPGVTAEAAVYYAKTSGTTGAAKLLPVTPTLLMQIQRQQALAAYYQFRACPEAFRGRLFGITGPAEEQTTVTGKTAGAISGVMYDRLPWPMKRKFIVPAPVFALDDHLTKYLLILRLALADKGITYMATANPSTWVLLLELLHTHREELLAGIATGRWPDARPLPPTARQAVAPKLRADANRARELRELFATKGQVDLRDLWPYVALVATWTGGNCRIPLDVIKPQLPPRARVMDLGFLASECRVTLAVDADASAGLPAFTDHFFEFAERTRRDEGLSEFLTLGQLDTGKDYYLFVTTSGGLYRYDMNDIVRVTGHRNGAPLLEFLQKGRGVTNITGEKLYEQQVIQAMAATARRCEMIVPFFVMLANRAGAYYDCYVESAAVTSDGGVCARLFDEQLAGQNEEYAQKRASGRLKPVCVRRLKPGAAAAYRAHAVAHGQRESQFKVQCLAYADEVTFDFASWLAADSA